MCYYENQHGPGEKKWNAGLYFTEHLSDDDVHVRNPLQLMYFGLEAFNDAEHLDAVVVVGRSGLLAVVQDVNQLLCHGFVCTRFNIVSLEISIRKVIIIADLILQSSTDDKERMVLLGCVHFADPMTTIKGFLVHSKKKNWLTMSLNWLSLTSAMFLSVFQRIAVMQCSIRGNQLKLRG